MHESSKSSFVKDTDLWIFIFSERVSDAEKPCKVLHFFVIFLRDSGPFTPCPHLINKRK